MNKHLNISPLKSRTFKTVQGGKHNAVTSTKAVAIITNTKGNVLVRMVNDTLMLPGGYYAGNIAKLEDKIFEQIGERVKLTHHSITQHKRTKLIVFTGMIQEETKEHQWITRKDKLPIELPSLGARLVRQFIKNDTPLLRIA